MYASDNDRRRFTCKRVSSRDLLNPRTRKGRETTQPACSGRPPACRCRPTAQMFTTHALPGNASLRLSGVSARKSSSPRGRASEWECRRGHLCVYCPTARVERPLADQSLVCATGFEGRSVCPYFGRGVWRLNLDRLEEMPVSTILFHLWRLMPLGPISGPYRPYVFRSWGVCPLVLAVIRRSSR